MDRKGIRACSDSGERTSSSKEINSELEKANGPRDIVKDTYEKINTEKAWKEQKERNKYLVSHIRTDSHKQSIDRLTAYIATFQDKELRNKKILDLSNNLLLSPSEIERRNLSDQSFQQSLQKQKGYLSEPLFQKYLKEGDLAKAKEHVEGLKTINDIFENSLKELGVTLVPENTSVHKFDKEKQELDQRIDEIKPKDVLLSRWTQIMDAIRGPHEHRPERVNNITAKFKENVKDIEKQIDGDSLPEDLKDKLIKTTLSLIEDFKKFSTQALHSYGEGSKGRELRQKGEDRIKYINETMQKISEYLPMWEYINEFQASIKNAPASSSNYQISRLEQSVANELVSKLNQAHMRVLDCYRRPSNSQALKNAHKRLENAHKRLENACDQLRRLSGYADQWHRIQENQGDLEQALASYTAKEYRPLVHTLANEAFATASKAYERVLTGYQEGSDQSDARKRFEEAYRWLEERPGKLKAVCKDQINKMAKELDEQYEKFEVFEHRHLHKVESEKPDQLVEQYRENWKQYQKDQETSSTINPSEWRQRLYSYLHKAYAIDRQLQIKAYNAAQKVKDKSQEHQARAAERTDRLAIRGYQLAMSKDNLFACIDGARFIDNKKTSSELRTYQQNMDQLSSNFNELNEYKEKVKNDTFRAMINKWDENFESAQGALETHLREQGWLEEIASTSRSQAKNERTELHTSDAVTAKKQNATFAPNDKLELVHQSDTIGQESDHKATESISKDYFEPKSDNTASEPVLEEYEQFNKILNEIEKKLEENYRSIDTFYLDRFLPNDVENKFIEIVDTFEMHFRETDKQAIHVSGGDEGIEARNQDEKKINALKDMNEDLDKWKEIKEAYKEGIKPALASVPDEDRPRVKEVADKEVASVKKAYLQLLDCYQKESDWSDHKKQFSNACEQLQVFSKDLWDVSWNWEQIHKSRAQIEDPHTFIQKEDKEYIKQLSDRAKQAFEQFLDCHKDGKRNDASDHKNVLQDVYDQLYPSQHSDTEFD